MYVTNRINLSVGMGLTDVQRQTEAEVTDKRSQGQRNTLEESMKIENLQNWTR